MPSPDPFSTSPSRPGFGARLLRAFRNLLILTFVLALAGATAWALAVVNSRTWSLEVHDGRLVVMKGRFLPWGFEAWQPTDPLLVDAYAPLELEGNLALATTGQRLTDRDEVDRALFAVVEQLARPKVTSERPAELEKGLSLVRRAERLHGLSPEQRALLKRLQGDVAWYLARTRLEDARRSVEEALLHLKLAADQDPRHGREAGAMLLALEGPAKALSDQMRAALLQVPPPPLRPTPPPAVATTPTSATPDAGPAEAAPPDAGLTP